MPRPSESSTLPGRDRSRRPRVRVDRIRCTGHGVCADVLPGEVTLDEWGYPIPSEIASHPDDGDLAVRMCPARALYWTGDPGR